MESVTFVVGTGRSGSTALSAILRAHPHVLSLNELFASLMSPERAFPAEPVTGEEFWRLLSRPNRTFDALVRSGVPMGEFLYPRRPGRYSADGTGIPLLCMMVLPHLTDDPDGLLDELGPRIVPWPRRPAAGHFAAFFRLLRDRFGRRAVVERSGYSLRWVPHLHRAFPRARFVHLHRNGPDCAVSMSRHIGYRKIMLVTEALGIAGVASSSQLTERHLAALPPRLAGLFADRFDPALVLDADLPLVRFATLWSQMIDEGVAALADIPADRRTSLSYERLLADPDRELARLAAFAGLDVPPGWPAAARGILDPARRDLAGRLTPRERAELDAACAPGARALALALASGNGAD
ncbi:sulfotransferase [Streptomyces sp. MP131-18]|uniref:sulfotransferase family protein n=1 Tax=Streptomyces sp. MP131-18 TaxID=1857892 RepID=UPI0009A1821B|nr:sulfotransferase [Streptomyces sp. MP131-18]ONK15834.1 Sulfotransferase domain protein [Streptomyces sp. MP131-18]